MKTRGSNAGEGNRLRRRLRHKRCADVWDGVQNWSETRLGSDLGRYSFREWRTELPLPAGTHELKVRAINRIGQSQPMTPLWNPPGYLRNVVETVRVVAA